MTDEPRLEDFNSMSVDEREWALFQLTLDVKGDIHNMKENIINEVRKDINEVRRDISDLKKKVHTFEECQPLIELAQNVEQINIDFSEFKKNDFFPLVNVIDSFEVDVAGVKEDIKDVKAQKRTEVKITVEKIKSRTVIITCLIGLVGTAITSSIATMIMLKLIGG